MNKERVMELEIRRQIYNLILKYPGLHFREISRKLNVPISTLGYHLKYLERHGFLIAEAKGGCNRFYVANNIGEMEKKLINFLRKDASRNIIMYIATLGGASLVELSQSLDLSRIVVWKHLKRLIDAGIVEPAPVGNGVIHTTLEVGKVIERTPIGREVVYRTTRMPNSNVNIVKLLENLLIFCEDEIANDETTKNILDHFYTICPVKKARRKRIKTFDNSFKRLENVLFDIFPHPYHV